MKDLTPDMAHLVDAMFGEIDPGSSLDEEGYLKSEVSLHLTALEAGALAGLISEFTVRDRFLVYVKGRARPMKISSRILEKLEAAHDVYRRSHGLPNRKGSAP